MMLGKMKNNLGGVSLRMAEKILKELEKLCIFRSVFHRGYI